MEPQNNIFENRKTYNRLRETYASMNEKQLVVVRSLIVTDYSLEKTIFITNESLETIHTIYNSITNIQNQSPNNAPSVPKKKVKHIDSKKVRSYLVNQLTSNNPTLVIRQIKNNTIICNLNGVSCTIKFTASRQHQDNSKLGIIYSWSRCKLDDLNNCDFFIATVEYNCNGVSGYKSILFNAKELGNFLALKNFTGDSIHFGFAWDNHTSTKVSDVRELSNILQANAFDADNKKWVLK